MTDTQADHMVSIRLNRPFDDELARLLPEEQQVLQRWGREGKLGGTWVNSDKSGAFLLVRGESVEAVSTLLKDLPMHPYMDIEITAIGAPA